jgi:hypothetical protein
VSAGAILAIIIIAIAASGVLMMRFRKRWLALTTGAGLTQYETCPPFVPFRCTVGAPLAHGAHQIPSYVLWRSYGGLGLGFLGAFNVSASVEISPVLDFFARP